MVGEKTTLEKTLVGRFHLRRVRPGEKAPNQELPPKSGDIICMPSMYIIGMNFIFVEFVKV